MRRFSTAKGQILTEKSDDLVNPLVESPLQPPEELLAPVVVNMHVEERQGRKMSWIMDDLNRDIAKLRVIFVERLTESDNTHDAWKSKSVPNKSYEILKTLSAVSDWLADVNIDGESFTIPISEEEMKFAHDKQMTKKQFVEEQVVKMQGLLEEVLEKTRKFSKFFITRQGMFEKFTEYLGGKMMTRPPPPVERKGGNVTFLTSLQKAGVENYAEIEKAFNELEEQIQTQNSTINELKTELKTIKAETSKNTASKFNDIKRTTVAFTMDLEQIVGDFIKDETAKELIASAIKDFKKKIDDLLSASSSVYQRSENTSYADGEKAENNKKTAETTDKIPKGKKVKDPKRE